MKKLGAPTSLPSKKEREGWERGVGAARLEKTNHRLAQNTGVEVGLVLELAVNNSLLVSVLAICHHHHGSRGNRDCVCVWGCGYMAILMGLLSSLNPRTREVPVSPL